MFKAKSWLFCIKCHLFYCKRGNKYPVFSNMLMGGKNCLQTWTLTQLLWYKVRSRNTTWTYTSVLESSVEFLEEEFRVKLCQCVTCVHYRVGIMCQFILW